MLGNLQLGQRRDHQRKIEDGKDQIARYDPGKSRN